MKTPASGVEPWLPDLCRLPRLAAMLGMAELVVVVIAVAPGAERGWRGIDFVLASGFALWLALVVSVLLCVSRPWLSRGPAAVGAVGALLLAAVVAWLGSALAFVLYDSLVAAGAEGHVGFWRFSLGSAAILTLITGVALRYFHVSDRWQAQLQANARAQADALQARIRPHFLFNSMNLIASLLRRDPRVAEQAVLDLSDLFRAALVASESPSTLAAEVELAERYLAIESLRLGERLRLDWHKHEPLPWDLPMPRLVLQPLVENAVLHGISRLPEGGTLEIELQARERRLHIRIRNPAPSAEAAATSVGSGAGHAQRSILHRLGYAFGPSARMTAAWREGYYVCEVDLPLP